MKRTITINVIESIIPKRCRKARDIDVSKEIEYTVKEASSNDVKVAVRDFNKKRDYYYYDGNFYVEEDLIFDKVEDKLRELDDDVSLKLSYKSGDETQELLSVIYNKYLLIDSKMILKKVNEPVINYYEGYRIEEPKAMLNTGKKGYNLLQKEDFLEHVKYCVNLLNHGDKEKEEMIRKVKCQLSNIKVLMPEVIKNPPCYHFTYKGHDVKLIINSYYEARLDVLPYIDSTDIIKMDDELLKIREDYGIDKEGAILSIDGKLYYDYRNKFLVRITDYNGFRNPIYID